MEKQRIDSLKVDDFTLAEDIANYIDKNGAEKLNLEQLLVFEALLRHRLVTSPRSYIVAYVCNIDI